MSTGIVDDGFRVFLRSIDPASPGDLTQLEDILMSENGVTETCGLSSISLKFQEDQLCVAVAFCDRESHRFIVGEFVDSFHLANLETALVQLESRECLVPAGLLSNGNKTTTFDPTILEHLAMIFDRVGVLVTEVDKGHFVSTDIDQDLNYFLRPSSGTGKASGKHPNTKTLESKRGLSCLGAIMKYLDLKADDSMSGAFSMDEFSLENYVRLDSAATRALHLLPGPDDTNRFQSVFGVLNNCRTAQGQRLLAQWIRQPLTDRNKINERLDLVESLVEETGVRLSLHDDFLRRVPDFQRLTRKFQRKQGASLQDVYRIYQAVQRLPHAVDLLRQCETTHASIIRSCLTEPFQEAVDHFSKFQEMIESTLDLDTVHRRNEFIIRADFDDALRELKQKLDAVEESVEDEFRKSARKLGLDPGKSIKLDSNDQLGFFMRVTLKEEKVLREFKSFDILEAQKAGVRFRNATMSRLNETHLEVKREYAQAQQSIVDEVVRIAAGYVHPLHELNASTALLDVIVSLAVAAVSTGGGGQYVRPKLLASDAGRIQLRDMRHPCLEMQDTVSVIPNSVHLERGKQIFLVITGPNMGGKSTYIRGVGVIAAMAQIGSFVPCSSAQLVPVDAIMARVGAADCQIRGVSTFMAEMLETASVVRAATPNSLVIIDELGRGTSTYDGFGLAWAVASHLAGPQLGCFTLFATHFHELTSLAHQMHDRVANYRVTAHVGPENATVTESKEDSSHAAPSVVMLYKVEPGICQRSYGLDVARLAGLPQSVIAAAESKSERDEQLESLWLTLDGTRLTRENTEEGGPAKRMRFDTDENMSKMQTSDAVAIADKLREQLIPILSQAIDDVSVESEAAFGAKLAELTRVMVGGENFPPELLNRLS